MERIIERSMAQPGVSDDFPDADWLVDMIGENGGNLPDIGFPVFVCKAQLYSKLDRSQGHFIRGLQPPAWIGARVGAYQAEKKLGAIVFTSELH